MGAKQNNMAKISDNTEVALPLRNILSMIAGASIATWAYFGIVERLNQIETQQTMMSNDVTMNTEFRIKWPRGEMGSLPADSEQYLLIENTLVEVEKLTERVDGMMNNKVNIERLIKDVDKLSSQLEILKDKVRLNGNGAH